MRRGRKENNNAISSSQYFVRAATDINGWHLRATSHDERGIVEMVCVEQKYVFAMMADGSVKRLAENDSLQFNEIGFRNRSECAFCIGLSAASISNTHAFTFSGRPSKWLNCIHSPAVWL